MTKIGQAYINFFLKSEEGQFFIKTIEELIDTQHRSAEIDGEKARDFTQRAKGVRLVQEHIQSVTAEAKKT